MYATGAFKNPFADFDFSKFAGDFKFPMINVETVVEATRKNFAALTAAWAGRTAGPVCSPSGHHGTIDWGWVAAGRVPSHATCGGGRRRGARHHARGGGPAARA